MIVRYVGIDQSLTSTGIVILDYDSELISEVGDFKIGFTTQLKKKWEESKSHHLLIKRIKSKDFGRTSQIANFLKRFIDVLDCGFDRVIVGLEGYSMGFTQTSLKEDDEKFRQVQQTSRVLQLGELGGVIKYLAMECGAEVFSYEPLRLKMYATGKGKGDKLPMYQQIKKDASKCPIAGTIVYTLDENMISSPMSDVTDAYYIAKMIRDHHWLKEGWIKPTEDLKKVFYKKTKKSQALIDQNFLRRSLDDN